MTDRKSKNASANIYMDGRYLKANPTWDAEDAPWKAEHILRIIAKNNIKPRTICEVGCGAGAILAELQRRMGETCAFWGYEISPQAFELCKKMANGKVTFKFGDILKEKDVFFDLILLIDVIEHIDDCIEFLRRLKPMSRYKILHIPLDMSVLASLRPNTLIKKRKLFGHLHHFTKETAVAALKDAGYEIIDFFYTASQVDRPARSFLNYIARWPRRIAFALHKDLAVRALGGYSMMVLVT